MVVRNEENENMVTTHLIPNTCLMHTFLNPLVTEAFTGIIRVQQVVK